MGWFCRAAIKFLLAVFLVSSLCMLVISLSTNFWIHYKDTGTTGRKNVSYVSGLWRVCRFKATLKTACSSFEEPISTSGRIGNTHVKVWLLVSTGLEVISVIFLFFIVLKRRYMIHLFVFCIVAVTQTITTVLSVCLFIQSIADINLRNKSYGWSFVICCISAALDGLLVILSTSLYLINTIRYRKKRNSTYNLKTKMKNWQNDGTNLYWPVKGHVDFRRNNFNFESREIVKSPDLSKSMLLKHEGNAIARSIFAETKEDAPSEKRSVRFHIIATKSPC
ncbi:uncharacterized protein LOC130614511 [Hydractinia symbiolongicarpus]|uniref:uncharacterized protein LOC130614511 n=1 Tax=Hydractinia symbiolongicarpus TaxID=13093 RepID=UPI0025512B7F|nr:uncharacterized protein LOC130614511 [Hydractinia symbiolongicarpus]